jgi:hypothetical protein
VGFRYAAKAQAAGHCVGQLAAGASILTVLLASNGRPGGALVTAAWRVDQATTVNGRIMSCSTMWQW